MFMSWGTGDMTIYDYIAIGFLIACAMVLAATVTLRAHS